MELTVLSDGTKVFDLLNKSKDYKDKFSIEDNIMGLRIHGLIGDCIKATTILSELIRESSERKYVILVSYNDSSKRGIIKDLFKDLIDTGKIVGLFLNEYYVIGNMSFAQFGFLKELGCAKVLDLYYHSAESYKKRKTGIAYLGFPHPIADNKKVALLRYSGFHRHVPLRHISQEAWLDLETYLISLGLDVHLYGYDDEMETNVLSQNDHRKKMSIIETIKHAADAGICITTTTFLPVYMHHFVPCLVFVDPSDLPAVSLMWRNTHKYIPINTQMPDYIDYVKSYVSMWYLSNLNVSSVLKSILSEVKGERESNL